MWSDNETSDDLLGFHVHCDLLYEVVTDAALLPVVVGVFGDWGGGKSSIMRMLEKKLETDKKIVCLYFNGWVFEGYEDAKTALLTSILIALGENKRFGPRLQEKVGGLLSRVKKMDWGRLAFQHIATPLAVGAVTGGVGTIPTILGSVGASLLPQFIKNSDGEKTEGTKSKSINWSEFIKEDKEPPELLEVRKFREDFEKLLKQSRIESLVILIDDLDRCLPPRIIETLEAIKLFVAVPKTAFVVGADARIVRHAIATRYGKQEKQISSSQNRKGEDYDLTKDYLEKLIQIPYHLPRLSPSEMESYINLLLCQRGLCSESYQSVVAHWQQKRGGDFYASFALGEVREALQGEELPAELVTQLNWSNEVAVALTEGLKGNPRQLKRMLNAMQLRMRLSKVAKLDIRADVLAKLMVLEYIEDELFSQLDDWQTMGRGFPEQIKRLESPDKLISEGDASKADLVSWHLPAIQKWLQMPPLLSEVDLRDYFWVARDRTRSTLSEASLVSTIVKTLFRQFMDGSSNDREAAVESAKELTLSERAELLSLLSRQFLRSPGQDEAPEALKMLVESEIEGAEKSLFDSLEKVAVEVLSPSTVQNITTLTQTHPRLRQPVVAALRRLAQNLETRAGRSAQIALEELNES